MCEMVELIPNRRIAWRSWAPVPGVKHAGAYAFDLASDGNGGTRLTQSAALEDNWLGDIVSRLVFKTTPEKARAQWQASLGNIKAILEASDERKQHVSGTQGDRSTDGGRASERT
jgi:hypothetical protein